ncbi:MAG: hypothetical protein ACRERD_06030 [Candidatus Binatia bacterium]
MDAQHLFLALLITMQSIGTAVSLVLIIRAVKDIHDTTVEILRTVRTGR